jgi:Uma2 family endonuclease
MTMHERRAAAAASQHHAPPDRRVAPGYLPPPPAPASWDDFLAWLDEDVRAEWVDGAIVEMSPASAVHQWILGFLYRLLMEVVDRDRGGAVFVAPFLMRLPRRPSGREPDLMFVSAEHAHRIRPTYVDGPADLVVEIVSPVSAERDYHEKLAEYEAAGVLEYWIIDPLQRAALFYQLDDTGRYQQVPATEDGIYTSRTVPGFQLRVSWLWQRPLPTIHEALADLPG